MEDKKPVRSFLNETQIKTLDELIEELKKEYPNQTKVIFKIKKKIYFLNINKFIFKIILVS